MKPPFRFSESKSLADKTVDEITKIGRLKAENGANFYIGPTTCTQARRSKEETGQVFPDRERAATGCLQLALESVF